MSQLGMPESGHVVAGKYRLERELGRGGMGAVFLATHVSTRRSFALKLLRPELAGDGEAEARFFREATLASSISHPAIVEIYDVGRDGATPYMVMKLLSGDSLSKRIERGPIAPETAIELLLPVLDGVAAAHAAGVVHRDLKPDNIMLHEEGGTTTPKVLDFGISKLLGAETREKLTKTGISLGTPLYMSPEQMRGEELDGRVDVYALGVITYQMLTGSVPYFGTNYADLVVKVMEGRAVPVRERNPSVAPAFEAVVMRAISAVREARQASVSVLAAELAALRGSAATMDTARVGTVPMRDTSTPFTVEARSAWKPAPAGKRKLWVAAAGAICIALGLIGVLWPESKPDAHVIGAASVLPEEPKSGPSAAPALPTAPLAAPAPTPSPDKPLLVAAPKPAPAATVAPSAEASAATAAAAKSTPESAKLTASGNAAEPEKTPEDVKAAEARRERRRERAAAAGNEPKRRTELINPFE